MAQNPYDRLAAVLDNAVANWSAEQQRQKLLAEQEAQRQKLRGEQIADRDEARDYTETQRQAIRGEQREDAAWAQEKALIASLIQEGFLNPADANDPAKVAAAWANLTPEAKQRVQYRKQAIDEIGKLVGTFGTDGLPEGAETPELLAGDDVFVVLGALRKKAAAAKQRIGLEISKQLGKISDLEGQRNALGSKLVAEITPDDVLAAKRIIEQRYGPGSSRSQKFAAEIEQEATQQAEARINSAKLQIGAINSSIAAATRQMGVIDGLNRSQVYLPEQQAAAMVDPNAAAPAAPADSGDPMASFLDPDGSKAKAKAERAKAEDERNAALAAADPYAAQAKKEKDTEYALNLARQFQDVFPSASRTNAQLQQQVEDDAAFRTQVNQGYFVDPFVSTQDKSEKFRKVMIDRDTDRKKAAELVPLFKDVIDTLPEEQKKNLLKQFELFANPSQ